MPRKGRADLSPSPAATKGNASPAKGKRKVSTKAVRASDAAETPSQDRAGRKGKVVAPSKPQDGAPTAKSTRGKTKAKEAKPAVLSKFSLKAVEQPSKTKKSDKSDPASKPKNSDDVNNASASGKQTEESPDVKFHKRMTKEKLALIARSPLSRLLSEKEKDAAAEEVYGKGVKFLSQTKRKADDDVDEIIPLDSSKPPKKKSKPTAEGEPQPLDPAQLAARRKETRKLKRKVRQIRARGELPDEEKEAPDAGVVYLGHIPHGFYENEMRGYFSQFGQVTRVRLSRSKRTARSRGFAFIEFADSEVAVKAAESMDGYLMHGQKLVAKLVPPEKVHPETFKGANRVFKKIPFSAIERRAMIQRSRDPLKLAQRSRGVQKKVKGKKEKLARKGINYEYPEITPIVET